MNLNNNDYYCAEHLKVNNDYDMYSIYLKYCSVIYENLKSGQHVLVLQYF